MRDLTDKQKRQIADILIDRHLVFLDVMNIFSFEELYEFLDHPEPCTSLMFGFVREWTRPKQISHPHVLSAAVEAKIASSNSEARRLIQNNGLSWNGQKVTQEHLNLTFLEPGWGVFKAGKSHTVVLEG